MIINKLLSYYQNELAFLKRYGVVFSEKFPKVASRLGFNDGVTEDPHVERIIESFALLSAKISHRLDEEAPAFTQALLTSIAPQFLRPIPTLCIAHFEVNAQHSGLTHSSEVVSGTRLWLPTDEGESYYFKTRYPLTIQPLTIERARLLQDDLSLTHELALDFSLWEGANLHKPHLNIHLNGPVNVVNLLYTLICSQMSAAWLCYDQKKVAIPLQNIQPIGFSPEQQLIPNEDIGCFAHSVTQEFFYFPKKFHFFNLLLLLNSEQLEEKKFTVKFEFNMHPLLDKFKKLLHTIDASYFKLNCTPIINLFEQSAEPIMPSLEQQEYAVIPDIRQKDTVSVWSINEMRWLPNNKENGLAETTIIPLFGLHQTSNSLTFSNTVYWQQVHKSDDLFNAMLFPNIAFTFRGVVPFEKGQGIVSIKLTCLNQNIAKWLDTHQQKPLFESALPMAGVTIRALHRPTDMIPPLLDNQHQWQLISLLTLNHHLMQGKQGVEVLRNTLSLYNIKHDRSIHRLIHLMESIEIEHKMLRLNNADPLSLARGVAVTIIFIDRIECDEEYYLFSSILNQFLGLYAPINGFIQLTTCDSAYSEKSRLQWPLRAGRLEWL